MIVLLVEAMGDIDNRCTTERVETILTDGSNVVIRTPPINT